MTADWQAWLDTLEDAAARLERQLAAGEVVTFPDVSPPPVRPGASGLSAALLARAGQLLDHLEHLQRTAEAQRNALGAKLQTLAVPRPRAAGAYNHDLGSAVDVVG